MDPADIRFGNRGGRMAFGGEGFMALPGKIRPQTRRIPRLESFRQKLFSSELLAGFMPFQGRRKNLLEHIRQVLFQNVYARFR